MVYEIYYGDSRPRNVLFDIEIHLSLVEEDCATKGLWFVELHSDSFISGATDFLFEKFYHGDGFNIDEFKKDCYDLEELRGWLWETHSNHPRPVELASKDKNEWEEYVREKIYSFANKYKLNINTD